MTWGDRVREHGLDIGSGHFVTFPETDLDLELNPHMVPLVEQFGPFPWPWGIIDLHPDKRDPSKDCGGACQWDTPANRAVDEQSKERNPDHKDRPVWTLVSREPLTMTPSLLCRTCGSHGFITDGQWREC